MSWHFLQGQEEASWEGNSLDGAPFALSSLIPTVDASSLLASATEALIAFPSGTTSEPSMGGHGLDLSTSSVEVSPVRTLAQQVSEPGSKEKPAGYGVKCPVSFARYDHGTSSWKTRQLLLTGGSEEFLGTWPRWGLMRDGECSALLTLEHDTSVKGCLSLPTPTRSWGRRGPGLSNNLDNMRMTASATMATLTIVSQFGWRWPPALPEMMMGWPIGWSALRPLATGKFQQWLRSHGKP